MVMQEQYDISFAFNRRYLATAVIVWLISLYVGLNFSELSEFSPRFFTLYTLAFAAAVLTCCIILRIIFRHRHELCSYVIAIGVATLIFLAGFSRVYYVTRDYNRRAEAMSAQTQVSGIVKSEPQLTSSGKSYSFLFDVYSGETNGKPCFSRIKMYIGEDKIDEIPKTGDALIGDILFEVADKPAFEGDFDVTRYYMQNKIYGALYAKSLRKRDAMAEPRGVKAMLTRLGITLREKILNSIEGFPYGEDEKALLRGILVGDKSEFSDEFYARYKQSGFMHIVAVSGMHTSYLFMAVALLLSLFRFPKRAICVIAIPIMTVFSAVAMFTPSVCRAVIMTVTFLISTALRRSNDSITAIAIAAAIITAENPYCLESISFLFSFGATLGILVFCIPVSSALTRMLHISKLRFPDMSFKGFIKNIPYRFIKYVGGSVCVSAAAAIGMAYFMMHFFGYFQWGSIAGGILVFPLTAAAFIGGYSSFAVSGIMPKAAYTISKYIVNPALCLINSTVNLFANNRFIIKTPMLPRSFFPVYIVICAGLYIMLMPRRCEK